MCVDRCRLLLSVNSLLEFHDADIMRRIFFGGESIDRMNDSKTGVIVPDVGYRFRRRV